MSTALPAPRAANLIAGVPGAFLAHGSATDVDAAFDDAVDAAGYEYGFAGMVPSVASVDADTVTVLAEEPVTLAHAALQAVRSLHDGTLEPGRAYALAVCPDSSWRRRRVRLQLTDPELSFAEEAGQVANVPVSLESVLRGLVPATGDGLSDSELLESVEVTAARPRYRPVVETFKGASAAEHVVLDPSTGTIVASGFRTTGEARRHAVTLAKQGPVGGSPVGTLEVVKLTRREGGHPLLSVTRARVGTRLVVKVTAGSVKNPDKTKTTGWLFFGTVTPSPAEPAGAPAPTNQD